jgi:hypothetical protein
MKVLQKSIIERGRDGKNWVQGWEFRYVFGFRKRIRPMCVCFPVFLANEPGGSSYLLFGVSAFLCSLNEAQLLLLL